VIDSRELRRRAADGGVVSVDAEGRYIEDVPGDVILPALLVVPVTDAVKHVDGDRLAADLDRSLMWSVRAVAVDVVVAGSVPDGAFTLGQLIQEVEAAGHVWHTTLL
jgi:hypothetical protein